ncbi:hypothetical protein [Streptomyces hirsutus]
MTRSSQMIESLPNPERFIRLTRHWPWTGEITAALKRLALLPNPG